MKTRWIWAVLAALMLLPAGCAADGTAAPAEAPASETAAPAEVPVETPAEVTTEAPAEVPAETQRPAEPETAAPAETPAGTPAEAPAAAPAETPAAGVDALGAALQAAGLTEADIRAPLVERDVENGTAVFEVEFYVPSQRTEYEFEIDAGTGAVRAQSSETKGIADAGDASVLPESQILAAVLERVPGAAEGDVALFLERDDGTLVYEGYARYDGTEYEFEIDPWTGSVLEWDTERIGG